MPAPVPPWAALTWPGAKTLALALYTCDGTADNPQGVAFHSCRPILFEAYTQTPTLATSTGGTQTALSTSGTTTGGLIICDSAGYYGMTQDQPGAGYYQFLAAVKGSSGDGATAGGWMLLSHFAAIAHNATQTSVSADLLGTAMTPVSGTRQAPSSSRDACAFFLDLVNVGTGTTWQPAVTIADSGSNTATTVVSADSSGETCRFCAIWAAASAATQGQAVFPAAGIWPWTAPAQVTTVNFSGIAPGGGGGSGAASGPGVEFGGGGAGGGESVQLTGMAVTPGTNYTVTVGAGGLGGAAPGSNGLAGNPGAAGGNNVFTADGGVTATAHGGHGGTGATTSANGTGGAGGTGAVTGVHASGGAGANGKTAVYGGGGGSSASQGVAGTTATSSAGAQAPGNGGPGGSGGQATITLIQRAHAVNAGTNALTVELDTALQAGSMIVAFAYYQGRSPTADPTAKLDDGTALASAVTADETSIGVPLQVGVLYAGGVHGGETSVTITGYGTDNSVKAIIADVYEFAGMGPSPAVDVSASTTQGGGHPNIFYGAEAVTTGAPELWVAATGGQYYSSTTPFSVNDPAGNLGWITTSPHYESNGGFRGALLAGYQIQAQTGTMNWTGTYSQGVSKGTLVAAFTNSAATAGTAPVIGPGGGGGAGLGSANGGGNGDDGQVTLTWAGASGSLYGTPSLPAPEAFWGPSLTLGTSGDPSVSDDFNNVVAGPLNFLSSPPAFRVATGAGQSIPASANTAVTFAAVAGAAAPDSYAGWNFTTSTYTIPRDGLYLFHGLVCFTANSSANRRAGALINGTVYWGPPSVAPNTGTCNTAKTQIFSLKAGDTVQLACRQSTTGSLSLATTDLSRFFLLWLGEVGLPQVSWSPPDPTFRFTSGTDGGDAVTGYQAHFGNDLGFLCNRPYLLARQATAQTGLTVGSFTTVTLDTVGGRIHTGDAGDNYAGWNAASNSYVAPVPGWYLCAGEVFGASSSSAGSTLTAGLAVSSSGGATPASTPDWGQQQVVPSNATGGAALFEPAYLLAGESVSLQVRGAGYPAAYNTIVGSDASGQVNSHLEVAWISN